MTTALETALVVKRDPILEALQQHLRWRTARLRTTTAHVSFIKLMLVKAQEGRITAADAELYQRRVRLEERRDRLAQRRKKELERLVAAHQDEA
jgi:hypothetical protein